MLVNDASFNIEFDPFGLTGTTNINIGTVSGTVLNLGNQFGGTTINGFTMGIYSNTLQIGTGGNPINLYGTSNYATNSKILYNSKKDLVTLLKHHIQALHMVLLYQLQYGRLSILEQIYYKLL